MSRTSNLTLVLPALAALLLAAPHAALAAEPPDAGGRRLTLDEALRLASSNSLDLKVARTRLDQAQVGVQTAWASLLPNVAAQGKYTHNYKEVVLDASSLGAGGNAVTTAQATLITDTFTDLYTKVGQPPSGQVLADQQALAAAVKAAQSANSEPIVIQKGEQLDASLSASVPLVVPWAWFQLRAARQSASAAEAGFEVTRAQVLLSVAQAFFVAAGTDEMLAAQRHGVEVAGKTLDDAKAKVAAGTANRVELTRAQVAFERASQATEEADAARAQAYRGLSTAIGLQGEYRVDPGALPADRFTDGEDLGKLALKLRPEFTQSERTLAASDETANASLWRWAPTLSAFGNLRGFNYAGFNGDKYAWAVGLTLDWVLYDGGARDAQRHLARAQGAEAQARLDQLHLTIRDDIENSRRNVSVKRRAVDTATHAVALSQETLALVRVQHDAGTATQLDLLTAQDQLIAAERLLAQARFDFAVTDLTLQRQVGTFPANLTASTDK